MINNQGETHPDILELTDDNPTIVLGSNIDSEDEEVPPFYMSLNVHDMVLHNVMLDSGASHNLMPKVESCGWRLQGLIKICILLILKGLNVWV